MYPYEFKLDFGIFCCRQRFWRISGERDWIWPPPRTIADLIRANREFRWVEWNDTQRIHGSHSMAQLLRARAPSLPWVFFLLTEDLHVTITRTPLIITSSRRRASTTCRLKFRGQYFTFGKPGRVARDLWKKF